MTDDTNEDTLPDATNLAGDEAHRVLCKALGRVALRLLDDLCIVAAHAGDEVFQQIVEELCDDLKPLLKHAARYGSWRS